MELSHKELNRISETVDMITQDLDLILEVGCGDGRMAKSICDKFDVVGIDIDKDRIKAFPGKKIIADISRITIKSEKFDVVLAAEVLEHLDNEIFPLAMTEITRVSRKYILITVPFEESLPSEWDKCSKCGNIFRAWGHLRTFNLEILGKLFKYAQLIEMGF